jgi:protein TonB
MHSRLLADDFKCNLRHTCYCGREGQSASAIPESAASNMLLFKVEPEYPRIAKAARVSGIVILHATISKAGDITNLRAICGPQMLQDASIKAVQQWKYRPYIFHGEPVEVETTIRVTFALGDKKKLKFSKDSCPDQ